jgi:hypothetical protein
MNTNPEIAKYLEPLQVLYVGTLKDLYPEVDTENHWHENILEHMKNDKKNYGMEENEPLCKNKVPREGIVIRIENSTRMAFKLKCMKFYEAEGKNLGKTVDIEMQAEYGEDVEEQ